MALLTSLIDILLLEEVEASADNSDLKAGSLVIMSGERGCWEVWGEANQNET